MACAALRDNGRYVKSGCGAAAALLLLLLPAPPLARAETVPGTAGARDGALAVAADGTPSVAYVDAAGTVEVATRSAAGWTSAPAGVPAGTLVGFDGAALLVESDDSTQIWLAVGGHATRVAAAPRGGLLGLPGLARTVDGGYVVAYSVLRPGGRSSLLLARRAPGGAVGTQTVVAGYPRTLHPPGAAPVVLPDGEVRVVEASDGETLVWYRTRKHGWTGRLLYANALGRADGLVRAVAPPRAGVWCAWTELFDGYGESHVLVALRREHTVTGILSRHAFVVELTADLEVAANDYVQLPGDRSVLAGEILSPAGPPLELGGELLGYAADRGGRQYLLRDAAGLEWFRAAAPPAERVTLAAAPDPKGILLSGRVEGAAPGGTVELWHEGPTGASLAAVLPLAPDGSFSTVDAPAGSPETFRAVYRDPAGGLPVASLVRGVFG